MSVKLSTRKPEDDNPFAKYNYTRRKRRSGLLLRIAKIGGAVLFLGLFFLLYKLYSFRGRFIPGLSGKYEYIHRHSDDKIVRENATLVMLVRNRELDDALRTMRQIEDRFNHQFHYPWVFLNDKPFTQKFRLLTTGMASGTVEYGLIQKSEWSTPSWIDTERMGKSMDDLIEKEVLYGGSLSYRFPTLIMRGLICWHMCRYNSGFFFNHPLLRKYAWYWRVEPEIDFFCTIPYDPFTFMREHEKVYGFVIALPEYWDTVPTLWETTKRFCHENPSFVAKDNALDFIVDNKKGWDGDYNLCHFWSNFEIANMEFWRSEPYLTYFETLDKAGGFYYERWGDAPVHSLAAALFLPKSKIHWFGDVGYRHIPWTHCPTDDLSYESGRCLCPRDENFDEDEYSCLPRWWKVAGRRNIL